MKVNRREYYFYWTEKEPSKINKINIITKDGVKTIYVDNLKDFRLERNKYLPAFSIIYEDNKKIMEYIIDRKERIKEKKISYFLGKDDIKNNSLNMKDYIDYEEIAIGIDNDIRIKDLIIDKTCMQNLYKLYDAICYIHYDKLIIIDNNEMKLLPDTTILSNITNKDIEIFQSPENLFYILYKKDKLIYLKDNEIKVIDKKKLLEDKNVEDVNIHLEEINCKHKPLVIFKYKDNKTKIVSLEEEIEIDKLFNEFILIYIDKYFNNNKSEIKYCLEYNDWYSIFYDKIMYLKKFKEIYSDYLVFLYNIKDLSKKGFSYKAIRYLYENHFENIINSDSYLNDMTNEEIDKFNELGDIYIKRKKLSRCSNDKKI